MPITNNEYIFVLGFQKLFINRWLFYKKVNTKFKFDAVVDFWVKDKQKVMLVYKTSVFFSLLSAVPKFIYRTSKTLYKNKYKPDSMVCSNNYRFLINARHFLYYGLQFKKAEYKSNIIGGVYCDLADYIKSNMYDFYHFHVSLRIVFFASRGVGVIKSLYRVF